MKSHRCAADNRIKPIKFHYKEPKTIFFVIRGFVIVVVVVVVVVVVANGILVLCIKKCGCCYSMHMPCCLHHVCVCVYAVFFTPFGTLVNGTKIKP